MPVQSVCCSSCWTWSPLGKRTTCRHCGGPLLFPDGYSVDEVLGNTPASPQAMTPAYAGAAPSGAAAAPAYAAAADAYALPQSGVNWVSVARLVTFGYGFVVMAVLIVVGLAVHTINVPVVDATTGLITYQTYDTGSIFVVAGVVLLGIFALFAWLTQYSVARVVFLLLDALAIIGAGARLGNDLRTGGAYAVFTVFSLAVDLAYGGVLLMTFISPPRRASH